MTTTDLEGTAYGRPAGTYERSVAEVGPQTPGGEWLRRYWHPVACSADVGVRLAYGEFRLGTQSGAPEMRALIGHCEFSSPDAALLVSLLPPTRARARRDTTRNAGRACER